MEAGPGRNAAGIRGGRCDSDLSRLQREQLLEQLQIFFHVTVRSLAGCGGSQFLAEPRFHKSRGQFRRLGNTQDVGSRKAHLIPIVANPHLSLAGGAVRGWDRRNAYYFQLIQSLARHTQFEIEAPFESLSADIQKLVLFGSGDEQIEFKYFDGKGGTVKRKHAFEGIVNNLERRYKETESVTVREELAKYRSSRACPECHGTRLNRAARNVFVDGKCLPDISALSVARAIDFFRDLALAGWRGEIAVKIVKEIGDRLGFL